MKNFETESKFSFPYVNLNGNKGENMLNELTGIMDALRDAIDKVAKSDFANGRNGVDQKHAQKMQDERKNALISLKEIEEYFLQVAIGVSDQL